jgi:hypothetical protein
VISFKPVDEKTTSPLYQHSVRRPMTKIELPLGQTFDRLPGEQKRKNIDIGEWQLIYINWR